MSTDTLEDLSEETKLFAAAWLAVNNGRRKTRRNIVGHLKWAKDKVVTAYRYSVNNVDVLLGYFLFLAVVLTVVAVLTYANFAFAALLSLLWWPLGYVYLTAFCISFLSWGSAVASYVAILIKNEKNEMVVA
jgi:hypothetical protein